MVKRGHQDGKVRICVCLAYLQNRCQELYSYILYLAWYHERHGTLRFKSEEEVS